MNASSLYKKLDKSCSSLKANKESTIGKKKMPTLAKDIEIVRVLRQKKMIEVHKLELEFKKKFFFF